MRKCFGYFTHLGKDKDKCNSCNIKKECISKMRKEEIEKTVNLVELCEQLRRHGVSS